MHPITIAITTYNRTTLLEECLNSIYYSISKCRNTVTEIVIVDDASDANALLFLEVLFKKYSEKYPDIRLVIKGNKSNVGMSKNKAFAIAASSNDWVIIFDSDNMMTPDYLGVLCNQEEFDENCIYAPNKAAPRFTFEPFNDLVLDKGNINNYNTIEFFGVLLNTCNYMVNKNQYAAVYEYNPEAYSADTINFNYRWLSKGNKIKVLKGMEYFHRVHNDSGFMKELNPSMKHALHLEKLIKENIWLQLQ